MSDDPTQAPETPEGDQPDATDDDQSKKRSLPTRAPARGLLTRESDQATRPGFRSPSNARSKATRKKSKKGKKGKKR